MNCMAFPRSLAFLHPIYLLIWSSIIPWDKKAETENLFILTTQLRNAFLLFLPSTVTCQHDEDNEFRLWFETPWRFQISKGKLYMLVAKAHHRKQHTLTNLPPLKTEWQAEWKFYWGGEILRTRRESCFDCAWLSALCLLLNCKANAANLKWNAVFIWSILWESA